MDISDKELFGEVEPTIIEQVLPDTKFRNLLDSSTLYYNVEDASEYMCVDDNDHAWKIDIEGQIIKHKHKEALSLLKAGAVECIFKYVGYESKQIIESENDKPPTFNTYQSPQKVYGTDICELPEVYNVFFHNFLPEQECRNYVLDWLATSLKQRLNTYLVMIGEEGIGKGTLSDIVAELHLLPNFSKMNDAAIKSQFNGHLSNKTLIIADEIKIDNDAAMNVLKLFSNSHLEYEQKGKDRFMANNYANLIITTNHDNALKFGEGARRFSIPKLTMVPMIEWNCLEQYAGTNPVSQFNKALKDPENITLLYRYLWNRKAINDMEICYFNKERYEEIMLAGMSGWQVLAVELVKSKKSLTTKQIVEHIENQQPARVPSERTVFDFFKKTMKKSYKAVYNAEKNIKRIDYIGTSKTVESELFQDIKKSLEIQL